MSGGAPPPPPVRAPAPPVPVREPGPSTLTVRRRRQIQNALIPIGVNLNGHEVAGLRSGQVDATQLPPGEHTLSFNPWHSATTPVSTWDGRDVEVEIWVSTLTSRVQARIHRTG